MKKLYALILSLFLFPPFGGIMGGFSQTFQWAKQSGGLCNEGGNNIIADADGNSYTAGWFCGTADFNGNNITAAGSNDVFLAKYNTDGSLIWVAQAGGTGNDQGTAISIDFAGNTYITGIFSGTASFGSTTLTSAGNLDVFVAKCSPSGQWLWAISGGSVNNDEGKSISTDPLGNSYITGYFSQTAIFGSHTVVSYGVNDILIAKCDASGNWLWVNHAGDGNWDSGNGITTDHNGNLIVTGSFQNYSGQAKFNGVFLSGAGMFIAKFDGASGAGIWAVKGGGSGTDIKADPDGNVYLLGIFGGTQDFSGTTLTSVGADDYFFARYSPSGALVWIQQLGGTGYFKGNGLSVGLNNDIFVTGTFDGGTPVQIGDTLLQAASPGYDEIFIAKFDYSGNALWVKRSEGSYYHVAMGVGDQAGNAYGTGFFHGSATFGSTILTSNPTANSDAFVTKINDFLHTGNISMLSFCPGDTLSVPYTLTDISFLSGNSITAQLSNASGSFASPVNIGTLNSTDASGTISATIPQNTAAGTAYRIRVIASSPLTIGADNGANITVKNVPVANGGTDKTICPGKSATLTASATGGTTPYSFLWNTSATTASITVSPLTTSTYTVTVTGSNGCNSKDSAVVNVVPTFTASISPGNDTAFCQGGSVILTASGGSSYLWSTGATTQSITASSTGNYIVTVTDANGCKNFDSVMVTVNEFPVVDAGGDTSIFNGDTVQIGTSPVAGYSYNWNPVAGLSNASISNPLASPDTTTVYVLTVDNAGCVSADTVVITVISQEKISLQSSRSFALLAGGSINGIDATLAVGNAGAIGTISGITATDTLFTSNDQRVQEAIADAIAAEQKAGTMPKQSLTQNLSGIMLSPGAYLITGNATLDGMITLAGNDASQYVFYVIDGFTVKYGSSVKLQGVLPENVLWIAENVLLEESTAMQGVIIASGNIEANSNNQSKLALFSLNGNILIKNDQPQEPNIYVSPGGEFLSEYAGATIEFTAADVPVCSTATFEIKINIADFQIKQVKLFVDLPPGINYAIGSAVIDPPLNVSFSPGPIFTIDNSGNFIPDNTEFNLNFDVSTGCSPLNSDSLAAIVYPVFGTSQIPFDTLRDTSNTFQILSPNLSISQQNGISPFTMEVNLTDDTCRTVTVKNTGNAPFTQGFSLAETYGPAIDVYAITGITGTIDSLNLSPGSVFMYVSDTLQPGGSFSFKECFRIVECTQTDSTSDLGKSEFVYHWGCTPGETCQMDGTSANVVIPQSNKPNVQASAPAFIDNAVCYGPDHASLTKVTISNSGTGHAFDVTWHLFADSGYVGILDSTFWLIEEDGDTSEIFLSDSIFVLSSTAPTPLCRNSFLSYISFDSLGVLHAGKSIHLLFYTVTCCPGNVCSPVRHLRDSVSYHIRCPIDSTVSWYNPLYYGNSASWGHIKANAGGFNPVQSYDWETCKFVENYTTSGLSQVMPQWVLDTISNPSATLGDIARYKFKAITTLSRWNGDNTQSLKVEFTNDGGLCYIDSSFLFLVKKTPLDVPDTLYPDTVFVTNDITCGYIPSNCAGTVTAFFSIDTLVNRGDDIYSQLHGSEFQIDFVTQCGSQCTIPPVTTLELNVYYVPSMNCSGGCELPVVCGLSDNAFAKTFVMCPGCDRSGLERPYFSARRLNYGLPDNNNNGLADALTGTPDMSKVKTNLVMVGDILQCAMWGGVKNYSNPPMPDSGLFTFGYYELAFLKPLCDNAMSLLDNINGKVYDASAGVTHNFTIPLNLVIDTVIDGQHKYIFDYSINLLNSIGVTPAYDNFGFGDSIFLYPQFKVTGNIGADETDCMVHNFAYLAFVPFPDCDYDGSCNTKQDSCDTWICSDSLINPCALDTAFCAEDTTYSGIGDTSFIGINICDRNMKYYCEKSAGEFYLAGYSFTATNDPWSTQINDCNQKIYIGNVFSMGINTSPTQFSYEYRNWGFMDSVKITLPPGFIYDNATLVQNRNRPDSIPGSVAQTVSVAPAYSIGDTLYFDLSGIYTDDTLFSYSNDSIYYSDDNFSVLLTVSAHPTCATPDVVSGNFSLGQTVGFPAEVNFNPNFDPNAGQDFSPYFEHRVKYLSPELSAQGMPVEAEAVTTEVCWNVLFENSSDGNASNVWLATSDTGDITITSIAIDGSTITGNSGIFPVGNIGGAGSLSGSKKYVQICATYNCNSTDTLALLPVYFGWDCPDYPDSLEAYPCPDKIDTLILELKYRKAKLQQVVNVQPTTTVCGTVPVEIILSSTDVADWQNVIVSTSLPAGFIYDTADVALVFYPYNSTDSLLAPPDISGSTLVWNLDSLSPFFEQNGLPGSGSTLEKDSTKVKITFTLHGVCGGNKNNTLSIITKGINNCGDTTTKVNTKNIIISDFPVVTKKSLSMNVPGFRSCDSLALVSVSIVNTDTSSTDSLDVINFTMPGCVAYADDFSGGSNPPDSSTLVQNGNTLTWELPSGVGFGDSITFSFNLYAASCPVGNLLTFTAKTLTDVPIFCPSLNDTCHFSVSAGDAFDTARVFTPMSISFDTISQNICDTFCNALVTAFASGSLPPYNFIWSNGSSTSSDTSSTADSLCSGINIVYVTDSAGCVDSAEIAIPDLPPAIDITITSTDVLCKDDSTGTATASASGGTSPYSFQWSNGDTTASVSGLPAAVYYLTVTDSSGCTAIDSVVINQPDSLILSISTTDVLCYGDTSTGSITATVSGGTVPYSYLWNIGDTTSSVSGLSASVYYVTVTDTNGCTAADSAVISQPDSLVLVSQSITEVLCFGGNEGSIETVVTGGAAPYSFAWSNGDTTQNIYNLTAGWYYGSVTDANGCTGEHSFLIVEPSLLTIDSIVVTPQLCYGNTPPSATAYVSGGNSSYSYLWSNGTSTSSMSGLSAGTYFLTVTDQKGCADSDSVVITQPTEIILSTIVTDVSCNFGGLSSGDGFINLTVSGGAAPYTYSWSNGATTQDIGGLSAGSYSVIVIDGNNCTASAGIIVSQPDTFQFSITSTDVICNGAGDGTATITGIGGTPPYSYSWNTGATTQTITGLAPGSYQGFAMDANGCLLNGYVTVSEPQPLISSAIPVNSTCAGNSGSIDLTVSGGTPSYSFLWSNGAITEDISGLTAGTYTVTISDSNGCTKTDSAQISVPSFPVSSFTISGNLCMGNLISFINNSTPLTGVSYLWKFGDASTSSATNPTHSYSAPGTFQVVLTVTDGCGRFHSSAQILTIIPSTANYNIACCSENTFYEQDGNRIIASASDAANFVAFIVGYGNNIKMRGDLIIKAGQTLSLINGQRIQFHLNSKVIVERSATFRVENGTVLTGLDSCNTMWQGIEVWGDGSKSHSTSQQPLQGKLFVNNATVQKAHIGVLVGRREPKCFPPLPQYCANPPCIQQIQPCKKVPVNTSFAGGIVKTSNNANFNTNGVDIRFTPFAKPNVSSILNTNFNGGTLPDPGYYYFNSYTYPNSNNTFFGAANYSKRTARGIWQWGVKNVKLGSNTFRNVEVAMESYDSKYNVVSSIYRNNAYGVRIFNTNSTIDNRHTISQCSFDTTGTMIYVVGGRFDVVKENIFGNLQLSTTQQTNPWGTVLINTTNYRVTNNLFNRLNTGILTNNSGNEGGYIGYDGNNNSFVQCRTGIWSAGQNPMLELKCNIHSNGEPLDYNNENWFNSGILADQGLFYTDSTLRHKFAAGNQISPSDRKHIYSGSDIFDYFHHSSPSQFIPTPTGALTTSNLQNVGVSYQGEESCLPPEDTCNVGPIFCSPLTDNIPGWLNTLEQRYDSIAGNLDNNKTAELLDAIKQSPPMAPGKLKERLLANSPLSDEVLLALIRRNPSLSNGTFKEVIIPNSPVSAAVRPVLDSLLQSWSNSASGVKKQIIEAQAGNPAYTTLASIEREMNYLQLWRQKNITKFIISLIDDSNDSLRQIAIDFLENEHTVEANQMLFSVYLADSNLTAAAAKLAQIPDTTVPLQQWKEVSSILIALAMQGETVFEMDSAQEQIIRQIAGSVILIDPEGSQGLAVSNAQAMLRLVFDEDFPLVVVTPTAKTGQSAIKEQAFKHLPKSTLLTSNYLGNNIPNPFNYNTVIPYSLSAGVENAYIRVSDISGRVLKEYSLDKNKNRLEVSLSDFENGIYFYSLYIGDELYQTKKMTLIK